MIYNDKNQLDIFSGEKDHGDDTKQCHDAGKENKGYEDCDDAAERLISKQNEYIRVLSTQIKTTAND